MANSNKYMENFKRIESEIAVAKRNESMEAEEIGSINFDKCLLKEVMLVPDLSANLLSVNAITKNNGQVLFSKNEVQVNFNNQTVLSGEKLENSLYAIKLKPENKRNSYLTENKTNSAILWHKKLASQQRRHEEFTTNI